MGQMIILIMVKDVIVHLFYFTPVFLYPIIIPTLSPQSAEGPFNVRDSHILTYYFYPRNHNATPSVQSKNVRHLFSSEAERFSSLTDPVGVSRTGVSNSV